MANLPLVPDRETPLSGERLVGDVIVDGRYRVTRRLGRSLYQAEDVWLERDVALAVVQDAGASFAEEARALARLRHDNVVQVHAFGAHAGAHYLAMERVEGVSLASMGPLDSKQALAIVRGVAAGLVAAHGRNVIHRRVSPRHVMVEQVTCRPVLVDFALGAGPATASVDVAGLGRTLFELLAGRPPSPSVSLSSLRPELAPLEPVLGRALADERERYTTCSDLIADLDAATRRLGAVVAPAAIGAAHVRVLVLEADPVVRLQLVASVERVLRATGDRAVIECFASPLPFVAAFERAPADIVILDDATCFDDAPSILRHVRRLPGGDRSEALLVSRCGVLDSDELSTLRARELPKPLSGQALAGVLQRACASLVERSARS